MRMEARQRQLGIAAAVILVLLMLPPYALTAGDVALKIALLDASQFPKMQALVTVTDAGGKHVSGLQASDFTVTDDGQDVKTVELTTASNAQLELAVALVIDASGSMLGEPEERQVAGFVPPIDLARAAAITFVQSLTSTADQVAVFAFHGAAIGQICTVTAVADFTPDKNLVINKINNEFPAAEGNTPFYDAVYQAVQAVAQAKPARKVVVALTDGEDTCSLVQPGNLIDTATRSGISIHVIGLKTKYLMPDVLERIARLTGGTYALADDKNALPGLYSTLAGFFKKQYVLRFDSTALCDAKDHKLTIKVRAQEKTAQDDRSYVSRIGVPECIPSADVNLADGRTITGTFAITPTNTRTQGGGLSSVAYSVDGTLMATLTQPPYAYQLPTALANGTHTVTISLSDRASPPNNTVITRRFVKAPGAAIPTAMIAFLGLVALLGIFAVYMFRRQPAPLFAPAPPWGPDTLAPAAPTAPGQTPASSPPEQDTGPAIVQTQLVRPPAAQVAWLVMTAGPQSGRQLQLNPSGSTSLGRDGTNDVVIDDPSVSRQHARIRLEGREFYIYDLAATNPTKVNGAKVSRTLLMDGDKIELGHSMLLFKRMPR